MNLIRQYKNILEFKNSDDFLSKFLTAKIGIIYDDKKSFTLFLDILDMFYPNVKWRAGEKPSGYHPCTGGNERILMFTHESYSRKKTMFCCDRDEAEYDFSCNCFCSIKEINIEQIKEAAIRLNNKTPSFFLSEIGDDLAAKACGVR